VVHNYEYGSRVYVGPDNEIIKDARRGGLSGAFGTLLSIAMEKNCKWLVLDCDGPVMEDLPKFEW
jgi:hypothetical protein